MGRRRAEGSGVVPREVLSRHGRAPLCALGAAGTDRKAQEQSARRLKLPEPCAPALSQRISGLCQSQRPPLCNLTHPWVSPPSSPGAFPGDKWDKNSRRNPNPQHRPALMRVHPTGSSPLTLLQPRGSLCHGVSPASSGSSGGLSSHGAPTGSQTLLRHPSAPGAAGDLCIQHLCLWSCQGLALQDMEEASSMPLPKQGCKNPIHAKKWGPRFAEVEVHPKMRPQLGTFSVWLSTA